MGYYDDHYEHIRRKQKGNRGGAFLAGIVGAILGGMLVVVAIPSLVKWDVLPYELEQTEEKQVNVTEQPKVDKSVAVDVVTQVTKAVNKVSDAVVGIVNIQEASFWSEGGEAGTGSGVIYKKEGNKAYIVTNHHVIEGASRVEVSLSDGAKVQARLLGSDVWTDLAVLEIDAKHVTNVAEFGNSDVLKVGEPVIAVGNPLGLQFAGSVTQGIISGVNRTIPIDIDQDGIPDWQGQVIGINSMKIAQEAVEGIGLSIPINYAKPVIADLEKFGQVRRPYMGVELRSLSDIPAYHWQQTLHLPSNVKEGVAILQVVPGSPAAQAGLREFDVIVALDGEKIADVISLRKHLYNRKKIGDTVKVTFYRDGKKQTVTLRLTKQSL